MLLLVYELKNKIILLEVSHSIYEKVIFYCFLPDA